MFFLYLIFFISALFQATFLPLNLLLCAVVALSVIRVNRQTVNLLFFSGILLSFLNLSLVGLTSVYLLFSSFLIFLYQRKFKTNNLYYWFVISSLLLIGEGLFLSRNLSVVNYFVQIIFSLLYFVLFRIITYKKNDFL
ncbi:hypothetical protein HY345_00850 [Candidatus Microgenomates bacterium]|nr:hypothetical protein [Candidatus Microgenomates bacterium]